MQSFVYLCSLFCIITLSGCYSLPLDPAYSGPIPRPTSIDNYYNNNKSYGQFSEKVIKSAANYKHKLLTINSDYGTINIDLYQQNKSSKSIVLVFPILKGKPIVEKHFAKYFVKNGLDAAIVGRNSDFMDPDNFQILEKVLQQNVLRDKLAIDFLQEEYDKETFATFGISRGAINAAITAGVDPRLKHNILVLGGTDIPELFEKSNQKKIKKYIKAVSKQHSLSHEEIFMALKKSIKSDPKYLAQYIDARHTLLVLGMFDSTVPVRFGKQLRKQLGNPKTIYLFADHYLSLAFTRTACSLLPEAADVLCFFPFDYIETEALNFYRNSIGKSKPTPKLMVYKILSSPFEALDRISEAIF